MEAEEWLKKIRSRHVRREAGLQPSFLVVNASGKAAALHPSEIAALPTLCDSADAATQVTDPTDPNYGQFYFIAGLSDPGGPDVLR